MDLKLLGKRALVTGSSSGLGEAIARALAREGAAIVVHGCAENEALRVAKALTECGWAAAVTSGDLTTDTGAAHVARTALAAFDGIDIVVNNVGGGVITFDDWNAPDPGWWLDIYNQSVVSMVRIIQHVLPPMKKRGWGRFIQIGSAIGSLPLAPYTAFGATKSAIVNLSTCLARALAGTGVTANTVSPGLILTPPIRAVIKATARKMGWQGEWAEVERRFVAEFVPNPTGRLGRVEDVADLVAFLASPCADYINGADLRLDGGYAPTIH